MTRENHTAANSTARKREAERLAEVPTIEEVLAAHADCVANDSRSQGLNSIMGSVLTGVDVWSCGLSVPFVDDYDDMHRAHLADAIRQAGAR